MHPKEPSRAEALAAMTPEKLEEMARPAGQGVGQGGVGEARMWCVSAGSSGGA